MRILKPFPTGAPLFEVRIGGLPGQVDDIRGEISAFYAAQDSLVSELRTTNQRLDRFISSQQTAKLIQNLEKTHNELVRILKPSPAGAPLFEVRIGGLPGQIDDVRGQMSAFYAAQQSLVSELRTTNQTLKTFISSQHSTELIQQLRETHNQLVKVLEKPSTGQGGGLTTIQVSTKELTEQIKQLNETHSSLLKVLEGTSDLSLWKELRDALRKISSSRTEDNEKIVNELKEIRTQIQSGAFLKVLQSHVTKLTANQKQVVTQIKLVAKAIGNLKLVCAAGGEGPCEPVRPLPLPVSCDFEMTVWDYRVEDGDLIDITLEKGAKSIRLVEGPDGHRLSKKKVPKLFSHTLEPGAEYQLKIHALNQGKVGRNTVAARFSSHADRDSGRWALRKKETKIIVLRCP